MDLHAQDSGRSWLPHGLADARATFRFAQAPWAEFRIGAGVVTLTDHEPRLQRLRPATATIADLYPVRPLVGGAWHADWGRPGTHILSQLRATAGITNRGGELYAGYGQLRCDEHHLAGLITGLRWWF